MKWDELLNDYKNQKALCDYLRNNQWHTRKEWAAAWTSQHRHYNTITSSPVEGMHKVLKDYLQTSRGDLLRVVGRIEQMINSQYNKYRKDIASSKHRIKFEHKPELMPYLPPDIHDVLTPPAIERIRQQDLLRQKERQRRGGHPCSGLFEKTNGLPCRHTLQDVRNSGSTLRLNHLYDDHWRYDREQGRSIHLSLRPHQSLREPLPAQTRGAPRRNEASTRRDPSAFERHVPPSIPQFQPLLQAEDQTLAEVLRQATDSLAIPTPISAPIAPSVPAPTPIPVTVPVTIPMTVTIPVTVDVPVSSPVSSSSSHLSSPSALSLIVVASPTPPPWQPPSLEEFVADIERRRHQSVLYTCRDPHTMHHFLAETGQDKDPMTLVEARNMALATEGIYASCTPTMAWNWFFGDKEAFYAERFTHVDAQNALLEPQDVPRPRPKRAAAAVASNAWIGLSPRKRQRRR